MGKRKPFTRRPKKTPGRTHGRRKYLSGDPIDVGLQSRIHISFVVHASGTTRIKGLYRTFPNRRKNAKAVPSAVMNPPWTRDGPAASRPPPASNQPWTSRSPRVGSASRA